MYFASDNTGPVHPKVMAALAAANEGYAASYGDDAIMGDVHRRICELFEAPDASVYLVATGTAANALILATLAQPWDTIYCARESHIEVDECNAPEFFSGGAKLTLVDGTAGKINPSALQELVDTGPIHGVHGAQRGPVSITQVTDCGTVYSLDEIAAITNVARSHDLPVHLDGARFANAMMALGCSAADMTWKAGIDAVSFGGTKNGLMGVEAVIFFDPKHAWEFELRRKRAAHLFSKHRYLSAQMQAYLQDGLWRELAARSNSAAARLAEGLRGVDDLSFTFDPQANIVFASFPRVLHQKLAAAGAIYEVIGELETGDPAESLPCRMVCDWSTSDANIDRFIAAIKG